MKWAHYFKKFELFCFAFFVQEASVFVNSASVFIKFSSNKISSIKSRIVLHTLTIKITFL
jgi:hypothetical protein